MICTPVKQKVIKGLGFTRLNQVIVRPDTAAIRGMVKKIPHLIEIVKSVNAAHGRPETRSRSFASLRMTKG